MGLLGALLDAHASSSLAKRVWRLQRTRRCSQAQQHGDIWPGWSRAGPSEPDFARRTERWRSRTLGSRSGTLADSMWWTGRLHCDLTSHASPQSNKRAGALQQSCPGADPPGRSVTMAYRELLAPPKLVKALQGPSRKSETETLRYAVIQSSSIKPPYSPALAHSARSHIHSSASCKQSRIPARPACCPGASRGSLARRHPGPWVFTFCFAGVGALASSFSLLHSLVLSAVVDALSPQPLCGSASLHQHRPTAAPARKHIQHITPLCSARGPSCAAPIDTDLAPRQTTARSP
jgi:hypothetical protein